MDGNRHFTAAVEPQRAGGGGERSPGQNRSVTNGCADKMPRGGCPSPRLLLRLCAARGGTGAREATREEEWGWGEAWLL